jgi:hypothetical protein
MFRESTCCRVRATSPSELIWTVEKKSYAWKTPVLLRATKCIRKPSASWVTKLVTHQSSLENNEQLCLFLQLLLANGKFVLHEIIIHFSGYKSWCVVLLKVYMHRCTWKCKVIRKISLSKKVQVRDNLGYVIPSILCSWRTIYYIHSSKFQDATTGWDGNKEYIPKSVKISHAKIVTWKSEEMKGNIKVDLMEVGYASSLNESLCQ